VPVCLASRACDMTGVGETLLALSLPKMPCVMVNPRVPVATKDVFKALGLRNGELLVGATDVLRGTAWPQDGASLEDWVEVLSSSSNDLEVPATRIQPVIGEVLAALPAGELELQGAAQRRLVALGHEPVGLAGHEAVEEALDLGGRERADELVDDPPVLERLHGGDALDLERAGDVLVRVRVELGEDDVALAGGGRLLQRRPEHAARSAPLGPEVDDDGDGLRALEDLLLEVLLGDIDDGHASDDRTPPVDLYVTEAGEGTPVVLLHGLTATNRYVVMGSKALERSGHRVIAYDARGHGQSDPAPSPDAYRYEDLRDDLVRVLDERGIDRAVFAGASMGAHTILRLALEAPERVAGLVVITPAYHEDEFGDPDSLARWDALSDGLRHGGVDIGQAEADDVVV